MANVFDIARDKVDQMKGAVNRVLEETISENDLVIQSIQVNDQLFEKGEDSKGSIIRPAYTPLTIKIKLSKGQPTDRVTWRDTGKLHKNVKVIARSNEFEIIADVEYANELIEKYGEDVLGIQDDLMKSFLVQYYYPNLKEEYDRISKS